MYVFLIVMLVAIGLLFAYEVVMLILSIRKRKKEGKKPLPRVDNNPNRKE